MVDDPRRPAMIEHWAGGRPQDVARRLLPLLTTMAALLADVMPLPTAAPTAVMPAFFLCVVFFWTIYRPDLLGPVAIFLVTIVLDGIAGLPLGLTALAMLVVRTLLMPRERFFATSSLIIVWASFVIAAAAVLALRWLVASMWFAHLFDPRPIAQQLALTVAVYPAVSYSLSGLRPLLPKAAHVSGS